MTISRASVASNETRTYPSAAIIQRKVSGATQLWMFACGKDHVLRKAISTTPDGSIITSWLAVPNAPDCATQPSGIVEPGGTPRDVLGVYYRSTANRLIELWYTATDTLEISDISSQAGLGTIKGMPLAADRDAGSPYRVAVVTIQSNGNIVSMDLYSNAWHRRPVLTSAGQQATAYGLMGVATYGQYYRPQFLMQTAPDVFTIFSRTSWTQSYTAEFDVNYTGVGTPTFGRPNSACATKGCIMFADSPKPGGLSWYRPNIGTVLNFGLVPCQGFCFNADFPPITSPDNLSTFAYNTTKFPLLNRWDYSWSPPYGQQVYYGPFWNYPVSAGPSLAVGPYPDFAMVGVVAAHIEPQFSPPIADILLYANDLTVTDTNYPSPGVLIGL